MRCAAMFVIVAQALAALSAHADMDRIVAYSIEDAREIPDSLTGRPGDPANGRKLYFDRSLTGCSGCHGSPGGPGAQADPGAADAPPLSGIARRMSEGAMRLWLVAPEVLSPDTAMPAYYRLGQRDDPADPRYGEPLLTAAEVEDIVAYLMLQTERP